ncbi:MAG: c-type cytochrome [Casimicrobiaceae bacterium]
MKVQRVPHDNNLRVRNVCIATGWSRRAPAMLALVACTMLIAGCGRDRGGSSAAAPTQPDPGAGVITSVPLGPVAGAAESTLATRLPNPYSNDAQAVQQGKDLYIKMNCAGCHGYGAKGGMGPNLTDGYWRYGGVPASIFNSIYQGRPQGMPAWNPALPTQDIWKIVAYIQSLGGSYPAHLYQAWMQGDKPGDNVPGDVAGTVPPATSKSSVPQPKATPAAAQSAPAVNDVAPAPGTGK